MAYSEPHKLSWLKHAYSSTICTFTEYVRQGLSRASRNYIGRSERAFRIRRLMSKFRGVSLLRSASKKGRSWEYGPGTKCKLLSSRSLSERLERSEKPFRKRSVTSRSSLGCSWSFCWRHKGTQGTYHLKLLFWNSFSECLITVTKINDHWGWRYYLPNFYSRRFNCVGNRFLVYERENLNF